MTHIDFLLAHRNQKETKWKGDKNKFNYNTENPQAMLYMTCPSVGALLFVYTKEGGPDSFEGLVEALTQAFIKKGSEARTTIVVSSGELKQTLDPILPEWTNIVLANNMAKALGAVSSGEALAAFSLGSSPPVSPPPGVVLRSSIDIILAKGGWIRRSHSAKCLRREHWKDLNK